MPPLPEPEPEPEIEPPQAEPPAQPAPPVSPAPAVVPPRARPQPAQPPIARKKVEGGFPSTPAAAAGTVGLLGLTVGAIGLGGGDGPANIPFAVASLGVSLVGFTTAGVFLILDATKDEPPPAQKPRIGVSVGPASAAVTGSFW